nr:DUF4365 domain-containing protein [uncultured Pseudomonas sp.]
MPTYKKSAVTAKEGINFIRSVVENSGSLFIKIEQESDLGVDGILEFIKDEKPLNKQIAVQIKSGASYYYSETRECAFPIGKHRDYWSQHPLLVFGLVYIPALKAAYWVNIKRFLKDNPNATTVRFSATRANKFDSSTFNTLFLPGIAGETPVLDIDEAFALARSCEPSETYLGLLVLFRRYADNKSAWHELIRTFIERPAEEIPPVLLYWLAHIPGHGDIFYFGQTASPETRTYARSLFKEFDVEHVIKLLSFIDPEAQIARGTLGQSVEAIVSSLPNSSAMLRKIMKSSEIDLSIREYAAIILAMNEGKGALTDLRKLNDSGSWYAGEIAMHVQEHGSINPYA